MTTRGMKGDDIQHIVQLMHQAFVHHEDKDKLLQLKEQVQTLAQQFPVPSL